MKDRNLELSIRNENTRDGYYETVTMVSFESVKAQLNLLGIDLAKVANQAFYEKN